jgi:type IX secretion system PorP/SprF family membrane protein
MIHIRNLASAPYCEGGSKINLELPNVRSKNSKMKNIQSQKHSIIIVLLILSTLLSLSSLKAQDPLFSQFYNNPIYYNPANIGLNPGLRTRFNYRDQWTGIPENYKTYNFSLDVAERALPGSGGIGVMVLTDKAGASLLKTTSVGLGTSARIRSTANTAAQVGFLVSYVQKSVNWDALVYPDQLHSRYGNIYSTRFDIPDRNRVTYPDFSVGGVYRYADIQSGNSGIMGTMGVAFHHVFQPNESFLNLNSPLPRKMVLTGDMVFELDLGRFSSYNSHRNSGSLKFNPGFIYEKQSDFSTFSLGLNMLQSSFYLGAWYRNQASDLFHANDVIFSVGVNRPLNQETRIKIMYSYDYIVSELHTSARSTHEISIVWELDNFSLFGGSSGGGFSPGNRGGRSREMECSPFNF